MAKKLTPDMVSDVLRFSSVRPSERLERIREGFQFLMYDQSQYVRDFGISVNPTPLRVKGRILPHPTLQYAQNQTVMPHNGAWKSKMFATPGRITGMILINMVANLPDADAIKVGNELLIACKAGGIGQPQKPPILLRRDANQTNYPKMFEEALAEHRRQRQTEANLIVFILVNQGTAAYPRIKHAGDTKLGVATQCLLMNKCVGARSDYFSNVSLKVNVKLGGVNVLPARGTSRYLGDPNNPTLFLGADVMHSKVPGEEGIGKPSFPAVVGSVDLHGAKYIGVGTAQDTREEMIQKLDESVGIKKAFTNSKLAVPPLTVVIVGKRHHIRWDPANDPEKDRSGNAPAGTIVDSTITSPVEFDFYLQAHAGIIGCCRAMHCNVILDENLFTPDEIQTLTFALCHVYARSTRSVSLPAPVYYAHLLCARADHRYDPDSDYHFEKSLPFSMTSAQKQEWLENSIGAFLPLHERTKHESVDLEEVALTSPIDMSDNALIAHGRTWETIESTLPGLWDEIDSSTKLGGGTVPYFDATLAPLHALRTLLDRQIALQQRAHNDLLPIYRLPRPILIGILQHAYNFFDRNGWHLELSELRRYAQVSTYWRDIILSTPWFWRAVRNEDGRAVQELCLRRNTPAGVIVWSRKASTREVDIYMRRMIRVAERWEVVYVEGRASNVLFDCLSRLPPGLKDLTVRLMATPTRVLPLTDGATLCHVSLRHVALPWDSVRLRALRSLELRELRSHLPSLQQLVTIVSSSRQLSVLVLDDWSNGEVLPGFAEDSARLADTQITLSSLEILVITQIHPHAASFLLTHIATPNACCITAHDFHFSAFSDPAGLLRLFRPTLRWPRFIRFEYRSRRDDRIGFQTGPGSSYTLGMLYTRMHTPGLSVRCSMAGATEAEWSNLFSCLAEGEVEVTMELWDYGHPSPDEESAATTYPPFPLKSLDHLRTLSGINFRPGFDASEMLRYLTAPGVCPRLKRLACFSLYTGLDEDIIVFVQGRYAGNEAGGEDGGRGSIGPLESLDVPHELVDSLRARPEMAPFLDVLGW
ncbi:hypothetical protein FRB99_001388 [Tulasnella sp. 403]|nr:hypothetical protein FRB99_001388 [Tulasnella sp. 403]